MEKWDLYTAERKYSGLTLNRGEKVPKHLYRLSAHVVIFNNQNQMLIQQRQDKRYKELWPNRWDISAGGSVKSGESSKEAAIRECYEELGLKIDIVEPPFSFPWIEGISEVYIIKKEVNIDTLNFSKQEVKMLKWASEDEVLALLKRGTFVPYLAEYLSFLFARSKQDSNFVYPIGIKKL